MVPSWEATAIASVEALTYLAERRAMDSFLRASRHLTTCERAYEDVLMGESLHGFGELN